MNNLEIIRQAAIKANPDKFIEVGSFELAAMSGLEMALLDEKQIIRLADVLLAINKKTGDYSVGFDGRFINIADWEWVKTADKKFAITWDMSKPLEDQSEETLQFLADLLAEPNTTIEK